MNIEELHKRSKERLFKYIEMQASLEKGTYMYNLISRSIERSYENEFRFRKAAYANKHLPESDRELQEFASFISLSSITDIA